MKSTIRRFFAAAIYSFFVLVNVPFVPLALSPLYAQNIQKDLLKEKEAALKKAIALNSKDPAPYLNLAFFYRRHNRPKEARSLYLQILAFDGESAEPYYGIGQLSYEEGKYAEALKLFSVAVEKYLAQDSTLVYDAFYYRGMCCYKLGDNKNALKNLQYAAAYYSDNAEILTLLDELKTKIAETN